MLKLKHNAEAEGLLCAGWRLSARDLAGVPLPAILLLCRNHFAVVGQADSEKGFVILDPVCGRLCISPKRLASVWNGETLLFADPRNGSSTRAWFGRPKGRHSSKRA
jgi:ABC-type bacteriocin/lantibiotic exporter with double-glycine peptidase domain